jgi:thiamine biosynthesis protein ThiS
MTRTEASEDTVTLTVNGDQREVPVGATLAGLLRSLALDPRMIVVEHNRVILRDRDRFDTVVLAEGDTLELVHFVGGG